MMPYQHLIQKTVIAALLFVSGYPLNADAFELTPREVLDRAAAIPSNPIEGALVLPPIRVDCRYMLEQFTNGAVMGRKVLPLEQDGRELVARGTVATLGERALKFNVTVFEGGQISWSADWRRTVDGRIKVLGLNKGHLFSENAELTVESTIYSTERATTLANDPKADFDRLGIEKIWLKCMLVLRER